MPWLWDRRPKWYSFQSRFGLKLLTSSFCLHISPNSHTMRDFLITVFFVAMVLTPAIVAVHSGE